MLTLLTFIMGQVIRLDMTRVLYGGLDMTSRTTLGENY